MMAAEEKRVLTNNLKMHFYIQTILNLKFFFLVGGLWFNFLHLYLLPVCYVCAH